MIIGEKLVQMIYEGKAKQIFETDSPDEVIIYFKDDATAFNGGKKDVFAGQGLLNFAFTKHFFNLLAENGVKTHYISEIDSKSFRAQKVNIIQLEVVVRNYAAGSICLRGNFEKGLKFDKQIVEFFLKDDSKGDPLFSKQEILDHNLATEAEIEELQSMALEINGILSNYLDTKNIILVDFKLEFGKDKNGKIILADEISPDTCRFWTKGTMDSLDKDVYRENKGNLIHSYRKIAEIIGVDYEI